MAAEMTRAATSGQDGANRGGEASTVIAEQDAVEGGLRLRGSGEVLGGFKGQIESQGELLIGKDAEVEATIRGVNVTIAGMVKGDLTVSGRLKITSTGRLDGDATVGKLVVQEGGVHHGRIMVYPEGLPQVPEPTMADHGGDTSLPMGLLQGGVGGRAEKAAVSPVEVVKKLWGELF